MNQKKIIRISVIGAVVIIAALLLYAGCRYVYQQFIHYYGISNYLSDESVELSDLDADISLTAEDEAALREQAAAAVEPISGKEMEGIYSILLIGSDRRSSSWNGNSDAMILITLNSNTKTLYMTSFMRDLYADVGEYGVHKLNYAYAKGGGPLLVSTMESNYGVSIDNYASVDFDTMIHIIDLIGGVDVEVTPEEVEVANGYIKELCRLQGERYEDNCMSSQGETHLNGIQAVAFQRIRYVGNADFGRTSRQRTVLQAIFKKMKSLRLSEVTALADEIIPLITHNVDEDVALDLLKQIPLILTYDTEEVRIPYDNMYTSSHEILIPDTMTETITKLRETIYAAG